MVAVLAPSRTLFNLKVDVEGTRPITAVIIEIVRYFITLLLTSTFLFVYLSYYVIGCYIQLVILDMKRPFRLPQTESDPQEQQKCVQYVYLSVDYF